ncbi:MAG: CHAT domain-containing protein [Saprospiraceae bacterium]
MEVIFLTFANKQDAPLPTIQLEDDKVYKALSPRALQQHYLLHRDSFTSIAKVAEYLSLYRDHITIFHYSGHAERDALLFEDEDAKAEGIAHLLGQCKRLKLVILNGCSTKGQVDQLLANGVPIVIATSAPVADQSATRFSIRFYEALTQYSTIEEAFELAIGEVKTIKRPKEIYIDRGIGEKNPTTTPIWGLFYRQENKSLLSTKLQTKSSPPIVTNFTPNEILIEALWTSLTEYNEAIQTLATRKTISLARKRMAILNAFPAPVAEHLRKLMVPVEDENEGYNKVSTARLQQIVRAYQTIMELLAFTMLAQLWENLLVTGDIELPEERVAVIQNFLNLPYGKQKVYDYIGLIRQVREIIQLNKGQYFMEELQQLKKMFYEEGSFQNAMFFQEVLRAKLNVQSVSPDEVTELCIRAEESLAEILSRMGFITRYALVAIQDINVLKFRHNLKARFQHVAVVLRDLLGGLETTELELGKFMDNRSIVLLNEENMKYLNLSPFIIDANAFEKNTDISKIYFVSHYDKTADSYCFKYIYKPEDEESFIHVSAEKYPIVKIQFDALKQLLDKQPV